MYYRGDFYTGRYRGDPGFLSFLKGIGSTVASFIPGVGPIASKAISMIPTPVKKAGAAAITQIVKHPTLTAAGTAGLAGVTAGELAHGRGASSMTPAALGGMRMGGRAAARGMGGGGRHRRMHVTNVKALRRSLRRIKGFEKVARSVLHFTQPTKTHGRAKFKFHRKRR